MVLNYTLVVVLAVLHTDSSDCQKIGHFAKVYQGKFARSCNPSSPSTINTLQINQHTLSNIRIVSSTDPAPLIPLNISSLHGSTIIKALLDSGADISAAGIEILCCLNEHVDNLIGKLPVKLKLGGKEYSDDFLFAQIFNVL